MYNYVRNILIFFLQLFADPMRDKVGVPKRHIRLNKQVHIDPDISHASASPDLMTALYSFNSHNQFTNFFLFNPGHIQKRPGALFYNSESCPENNKSDR